MGHTTVAPSRLQDSGPSDAKPITRSLGRHAICVVGLVVFAVMSRWVFLTAKPELWDPVQHALGLADFDVFRHTPHPPGAPTYHALLRIAHTVISNPADVVLAVGVALAVAAGLTTWALGRTLPSAGKSRYPGAMAIFLLASPALWLDGIAGGSCGGDAALAALVGLFCLRTRASGRWLDVLAGAATLAVLIGFRQNVNLASLGLLPLWMWSMAPLSSRRRLAGVAVLLAACAAWAIPTARACGGWWAWIEPTIDHIRLVNGEGVLGGGFLKILATGEEQGAIHLGMMWIPLVVVVVCLAARHPWRQSVVWRFTGLWVLPLIGGALLAPTHPHEYYAVALPIICWWAAAGIARLADRVAGVIHRLRLGRTLSRHLLARGFALSGAATIVFGNVAYFLTLRTSDPEAEKYNLTLERIDRSFDPATTLILSSGLGQRFASLSYPDSASVYLPALSRRATEPYAGRVFCDGVEWTFGAGSISGAVPSGNRHIKTLIVTEPIPIICDGPLEVRDLDGIVRYVQADHGRLVVEYADRKLMVGLAATAMAEGPSLEKRREANEGHAQ